ncbi:hypothetical protein G7054_g7703 [Neopestalotiopsis clavispora]|nr:hypothetical protein G7054_g7703 [Neopestalotiopsis clavispora]
MSSIESRFEKLAHSKGHIDEADVAAIFDEAECVQPDFMLGSWEGGSFNTGHPTHELLQVNNWAGKTFRTVEDVDPIVLYNDAGARIWCKDYGNAQLREVKFRGIISAAMIYDNFPIIDSFRFVSDNIVIGAMDNKLVPKEAGTYYFYLRKLED